MIKSHGGQYGLEEVSMLTIITLLVSTIILKGYKVVNTELRINYSLQVQIVPQIALQLICT